MISKMLLQIFHIKLIIFFIIIFKQAAHISKEFFNGALKCLSS
jgi:hypothetical protein